MRKIDNELQVKINEKVQIYKLLHSQIVTIKNRNGENK